MLLIEADGKALFADHGIPVPVGRVVDDVAAIQLSGAGPWMVKAQVPVGGRGKAGGIDAVGRRTMWRMQYVGCLAQG